MVGLIERYRDRLPFELTDPVVSLQEGSTPLVLAERVSERVGAEVWLKVEGANPTGSFKDRGMTMAISKAVEDALVGSDGSAGAIAAAAAHAADGVAVNSDIHANAAYRSAMAVVHTRRSIETALGRSA